jgi:hypothetical protein
VRTERNLRTSRSIAQALTRGAGRRTDSGRIASAVVALGLAGFALTPASAVTKPVTVRANTSSVGALGGGVTIRATVKSAKRCAWTSSPKVKGFDGSVTCAAKLSRVAKLSANSTSRAKRFTFSLDTVNGKIKASASIVVSEAAIKYVSGRLNVSGYTIAAVGYNGKVAFSRSRSFRIPAPDSKVTLQLISNHGRYAGPVVFGGSSTRVITGIMAGSNVGTIDVVAFKGYAHLARKLVAGNLDTARWAYAAHGVPIGNGRNLGLVASKGKGGGSGAGQDQAHVGIPNAFNIAVPGTRILKSLAPPAKVKTASAAFFPLSGLPPSDPQLIAIAANQTAVSPWSSQMGLPIDQTLNVDAGGVTQAEIDSTLQAKLDLLLTHVPSGSLVELNCNGLSFCSQGGTGQAQMEGLPQTAQQPAAWGYYQTVHFPSSSLDTATGFGELVGPAVPNGLLGADAGGQEFNIDPHATSSQVGSGDVATEVVTDNGTTTQTPITIGFVFNTVPAIAAYSDSVDDSGAITYPDVSLLGTPNNPLHVAAGPNGDVVVTFTVFRPQRPGVSGAGEPAFMDIGNLGYAIGFETTPAGGANAQLVNTTGGTCSTSSYSSLSPTLALGSGGGGFGPVQGTSWLVDSANDQPASPANTISFTIDLTRCLVAAGNASFPVGQPVYLDLSAASQSSPDHVGQKFAVVRTS